MRLNIDGKVVGEKPLTCSLDEVMHAEALKRIYLSFPHENEDLLHGYIHGLDVLFQTSVVKNHHVKVCFILLFLFINFFV